MALPYFIVDAFTNEAFSGNPAAVVPLLKWPADHWLQQVALEMNWPMGTSFPFLPWEVLYEPNETAAVSSWISPPSPRNHVWLRLT